MAPNHPISSSPTTSFITKRINPSTFLIIEDDSYSEQPHIYIKQYPNHLLITDTGCNSPGLPDLKITSLRQYLETYPIPENNNQPLNPDGKREYIIICTHCHYDHILGLSTFLPSPSTQSPKPETETEKPTSKPTIVASSFSKPFLLTNLPTHSLCKYLSIPTPSYTISHWATHLSNLTLPSPNPYPLRMQFLHIPGHTPDSLAWYDIDTHNLYIGDTFYSRSRNISIPDLPNGDGKEKDEMTGAIQFPAEGDWVLYMSSLSLLLSFTKYRNQELLRQWKEQGKKEEVGKVKVSAGHNTVNGDAEEMIIDVKRFFEGIIKGRVKVRKSLMKRGEVCDFYLEEEEGREESRFSVLAPRRLCVEARKHFYGTVEA